MSIKFLDSGGTRRKSPAARSATGDRQIAGSGIYHWVRTVKTRCSASPLGYPTWNSAVEASFLVDGRLERTRVQLPQVLPDDHLDRLVLAIPELDLDVALLRPVGDPALLLVRPLPDPTSKAFPIRRRTFSFRGV